MKYFIQMRQAFVCALLCSIHQVSLCQAKMKGCNRIILASIFLNTYICCINGDTAENLSHLTSHPGHLKPFGFQGKTLQVASLESFPQPSVFFNEYVNASKPLVIRGGAKISPAFNVWTDEYFLSLPEGKIHKVVVEQAKKENRSLSPEDVPFNEFVKRYSRDDIYMVHSVPDFIGKDVYLPPCLLCPGVLDYLLDKVMWFSSGGTKSVLHFDSAENINCLFAGEKILYMVDYKDADRVKIDNKKSAYSDVDVERVDLVKYPGLKDLDFYYVKMMPGDCLYIPYHWFHHVVSFHRNIAVNIWWSASAKPYLPDCSLDNVTIDQVKFNGFEELYPREVIDGLKDEFQAMFAVFDNKVTLEQFKLFTTTQADVFEHDTQWSTEMIGMLEEIFHYLDKASHDSVLTPDDVKLTSVQMWDKIVSIIKKINISVEEQFEQDEDETYDDFGPKDSKVEDEETQHERTEL